ncbi:MAG TPA: PIG-L family deacetylase [Candidatus Sulfotelmatobacter sp.]|nr:PIG-L family deacetylase [Candidatus Sulfotelmatobacter sp.]
MNRRDLLKAVPLGAVAISPARSLAQIQQRKYKVIVAGGHPGDPEYGCGGTVARLTAAGHEVVLLYLNDGAWETSAEIRIAEAKRACEILQARPVYANQQNGHAIVDNDHYKAFQRILESEKPDIVFTQWPIDNHADHRAIWNLTYETWKQLRRSFSLYYYEVSDGEDTMQFPAPTHYVDISSAADTKKAACYAHASQTPDFYYALQDTVANFRGFQAGAKKAEGYVLQVGSPSAIDVSMLLPNDKVHG